MRSLMLMAAALALLGGCSGAPVSHMDHPAYEKMKYAPMVHWQTLQEGRETALREKKPCLVDFAVPMDCDRCDFLQENVYSREEIVAKINAEFVPILIDLSGNLTAEETALGEKYDFRNDCLMLFLNHEGDVIRDPDGTQMCFADKIEPEVFMEYLDHVLEEYVPEK
jgi:hypothetical protein